MLGLVEPTALGTSFAPVVDADQADEELGSHDDHPTSPH
jgi:hypothetical protein